MAGVGGASILKPSAILLLISGSLVLTAIVLTGAPRTITSSEEVLELVEMELDEGDAIRVEVECSANGAVVELSLAEVPVGVPGSVQQTTTLSRTEQGFDGTIMADNGGTHVLTMRFQGLEGEAKVEYSVEGQIFTVWIVALTISIPAGIWGAWLKHIEDKAEGES